MHAKRRRIRLVASLTAGFLFLTGRAHSADRDLFGHVAVVLRERCVTCHGGAKSRGGLDLTTRVKLLSGGDSGPAIVPGAAGQSLLVRMISGTRPKMPREGPPLSAAQAADIRAWIDAGALWPDGLTLRAGPVAETGAGWWSLRPPVRPAVPTVKGRGWVRTPVDAFILAALEAKGLGPAAPADRPTLIRRVSFDLHGLPPTPAAIDAFVRDPAPDAYERLVERLLASPRYGERWGRHWLDIVHYGDTHGYDKDKRRDHAWPYRDYVIRSFNADKPYSRFVREQLAGDVLAPDDPDCVAATGFIAAGPWDFVGHVELREGTVDKLKTRLLDRDDMLGNALSTFVSLTVQCARCHDHKFDPIPQADYYRLQAVFAGVDRGDRPLPAAGGGPPRVFAVVAHAPRPVHVLHRGDVEQPRAPAAPGALSAVAGLEHEFRLGDTSDEGTRRAALARWITDPRNPLTRRSIVNRVWQYHFGRGLGDTPSDFGRMGSAPTHPELLDWLAVEFLERGESLKELHRLLLRSAAYRQSSAHDAAAARVDADNRLLWRMNRRRMDAEEVRDAVLAVSGQLRQQMGGPGFELFRFKDDHSPVYDHGAVLKAQDRATWRRTVYRFTVRSVPNPFLECLDCADPNINTPVRNSTLTALQALALLNDPFVFRQAALFAGRLERMTSDPARHVEEAYRLAFGRRPSAEEAETFAAFAGRHGLAHGCRLLFNANEFVFID